MEIVRSMDPRWLSNTWWVGDPDSRESFLVDSGGPVAPVVAALEQGGYRLSHVLLTHHHHDHIAHNEFYAARYGAVLAGGAAERDLFPRLDIALEGGEVLEIGSLRVEVLPIPGHTRGQLAFLTGGRVFTGDTLFRGSVGGTCGPGHGTYEQLRRSILEVLLALPASTIVHPGHMDETTIAAETRENPFVRFWLGQLAPLHVPCTAFGRPALLLVEARDYDGGTKAIVRFDEGRCEVVPGSRIER